MGVNTKAINRRIKSVANTRKITKAMELVSASKMRKAVSAVLASRPYAQMAWSLASHLSPRGMDPHPLTVARPIVRRTLVLLLTSDRGLCGGFNAQVLKAAAELVRNRPEGSVDFAAIGRRGETWIRRRRLPLKASFEGLLSGGAPPMAKVSPLARFAKDAFVKGEVDEVFIVYTDFLSSVVQKPRVKALLPLRRDDDLGEVGGHRKEIAAGARLEGEYLFEPDPASVLDALLPRIAEAQLYQAVLESLASEHSARMLAMKNATDAAAEMIDDLRLTFNQGRQAAITQEIAEISAGRAALANT